MFRQESTHRNPTPGLWFPLSIIVICCLAEAALQIADLHSLASRLRATVYENGGFWVELLYHWQPNYAVQPYTMFLTYGFLHAGSVHLAVNMITLWSLSRGVLWRVGAGGCAKLYFGAMIGGGAGHALLATETSPVVGASGALFGLAGGLIAWSYVDRYIQRQSLWPIAQTIILLLALNIVMWWIMDGKLAWQAHLGGFVSGWLLALLIDPRPHRPDASGK